MNAYEFTFAGARLVARGTGALYWPGQAAICVSDLHLGKAERQARRGAPLLPPYETEDTLNRLEAELTATAASTVICLGDSFDDTAAAAGLPEAQRQWIARLQTGRRWIWIAGNHDPAAVDWVPTELGGTRLDAFCLSRLSFRHIAEPGAVREVSGHYHPKALLRARGRTISRPAFLIDANRVVMPAFGTYTGGLRSNDDVLKSLMRPDAIAVMTGPEATVIPMPR